MAFYPINRNAPAAQLILNTKSALLQALNQALQIQREVAEMTTDAEVEAQYGFTGGKAAFQSTINGIVTSLQTAAVTNYISRVG